MKSVVWGICHHRREIIRHNKTPDKAPFFCDICRKEVTCTHELREAIDDGS